MLLNIFFNKHFCASRALAFPVLGSELRYSVRSVITELSATPRHKLLTSRQAEQLSIDSNFTINYRHATLVVSTRQVACSVFFHPHTSCYYLLVIAGVLSDLEALGHSDIALLLLSGVRTPSQGHLHHANYPDNQG